MMRGRDSRAGRRPQVPGETELRTMLTGRGVSLESQFRLTYSMILNLLRVEDLKVTPRRPSGLQGLAPARPLAPAAPPCLAIWNDHGCRPRLPRPPGQPGCARGFTTSRQTQES